MSSKKSESVNLWTSPNTLWLESQDKSLPVISISRDVKPQIAAVDHGSIPTIAVRRTIHGILGILELPLTKFLVVISQKRKVGDLEGHAIFRLESVELIPISTLAANSSTEVDAERRCQILIKEALSTPYFYFSYSGDLTNSRQRQAASAQSESAWSRADKRFLWNNYMAETLFQYVTGSKSMTQVSSFLVQLVHGAVFIHRCSINGVRFIKSGLKVMQF